MPDFAAAYAETRDSVVQLVRTLSDEQLALKVPACPEWTIKDLVAHLCHVAESYTTGNVPTAPGSAQQAAAEWTDEERLRQRDAWTASGVEARRDRSLDQVVKEWGKHAALLVAMLAGDKPWPEGFPGFIAQYSANGDLSAHENDIRGALGLAPERGGLAREIAYDAQTFLLQTRGGSMDVPAIKFVTQRGEHVVGKGDVVATIEVDQYELLRAIAGRRSVEQIQAMFGNVGALPYLPIISSNPLPEEPLEV